MQAGPARAEHDGVARKRRVAARVERDIRADGPQPVVGRTELDRALRGFDARAHEAGETAFGARSPLDPLIVELEVRVLAL